MLESTPGYEFLHVLGIIRSCGDFRIRGWKRSKPAYFWVRLFQQPGRTGCACCGRRATKRDEKQKILIVLSDGRPNDIVVNRLNGRNPRPYFGDYGTKIRQWKYGICEVRCIRILGVFTGEEEDRGRNENFRQDFLHKN